MNERAMDGFCTFKTWEIFRNSSRPSGNKQLPGTLCLAPYIIMGDEVFLLKSYLLKR